MITAGQRFGKLITVEDVGRATDGHRLWRCACDCGGQAVRQTNNLQSKSLVSCGCARSEVQIIHGRRSTSEWYSWQAAKQRCTNAANKDFHHYGGRGIQMCTAWSESFERFYADMGERPSGMTLERKNTDGNYEPGNCEWATPTEQARNRRTSVWLEWRGARRHLSEVAADLSITYGAAFMRFKRGKLHDFSL